MSFAWFDEKRGIWTNDGRDIHPWDRVAGQLDDEEARRMRAKRKCWRELRAARTKAQGANMPASEPGMPLTCDDDE